MRWTPIYILGMLMAISSFGQQSEQYSLQNYNPYMYNPGYAGFDGSVSVNAHLRSQWNEIDGNPTSQHLSAHFPMYAWSGGLGLAIENESLGAWRQTKISVSGNYVRKTDFALISFGANLGWNQNRLDGLRLRTVDGNYEDIINHNDPILPISQVSSGNYFLDVGLMMAIGQLQIGISAKNINEPSFSLNEVEVNNAQLKRSYFIGGRYNWALNEDFQIQPMLLFKSNLRQMQTNLSVSMVYQHSFMIGVGHRGHSSTTSDAALFLFGVKVSRNFWLRYAYDYGLSDLSELGNGSHELGLSYDLNKILGQVIKPKVIYNPRFLE